MRSRHYILFTFLLLGCVSCATSPQGRSIEALNRLGLSSQAGLEPELRQPASSGSIFQNALTQQDRKALAYSGQLNFSTDPFAREKIQEQFIFLTRDIRPKVAAWLTRSEKYLAHARKVFQQKGLPTELAYLAMIESGYNPEAVSSAGAVGAWQFMPFTGRRFNLRCDWWIDERRDPYKSAHAAANYLAALNEQFKDWSLAIAAYNAGEGKISRAIAVTNSKDFFDLAKKNHLLDEKGRLRDETLAYVPRFIAMVMVANNLEQLGFQPINTRAAPELHALQVPGGTDLLALAQAAGMSPESFAAHNPAFRREATPPGEQCIVYVPSHLSAGVRRFLTRPLATRYAAYRHYTVQRGDTWNKIAKTCDTSVQNLKNVNKQSAKSALHPGQRIIVPAMPLTAKAASGQAAASRISLAQAQVSQRATASVQPQKQQAAAVNAKQPANTTNTKAWKEMSVAAQVQSREKNTAGASYAASTGSTRGILYRVRPGDTVYSIARRFSVSVNDVQQANNLSSATITPGQVLGLPAQQSPVRNI